MSLEKIVAEALAGRPLEMKEAFEEEIQTRIQARLEAEYMNVLESKDEDEDEDEDEDDEDEDDEDDLDESEDTHHTVDIDHMGGNDDNAKKHNITLKKTNKTSHSHDATGTKENLKKYLAKHYDDADEAKEMHPELHK